MRPVAAIIVASCAATLVLSGCGWNKETEPRLLNVKSNITGPDEFAILPNKPLTLPQDYAALPEPTPGGSNLTDVTPMADATRALGGNPNARSGEPGLLAYATRYGVSPSIRSDLATEDLQYRRDNDGRLLERWFNVNVYFKAYRDQSLDQFRELERLRRLGIRTVSAPPEEEGS
ncbi:MAG: DUF3035 domain-containing protein [Paracoccaceae bacterium]